MADTTTKKILIEVEAKYAQIDQALRRMSDLAVEIQALKTLKKEEGKVNEENAVTVTKLNVALKAAQKEYSTLNRFVTASTASAKAFETAIQDTGITLLSQEAQLTKSTLAWKGLTQAERESEQGVKLKAQIDALTKSLYENGTQLDKNKLTVGNYAGEIEGLILKMSKEGQVVGASSQAYSELLTKYQLAEMKARELVLTTGEQSAASLEAIADVKKYGAELDKLNTTMGKYSAKTVNASYSTFSLSQVVREMPNFAIDARLGFMALSNNLPMLAQDFQMLSKQLGSSKLAFQAFAKSLVGVNTIMVLLSTALIAWGPQIVPFTEKLFRGAKAADEQTMKLKALNDVLKKSDSTLKSAINGQIRLGVVLDKAKDGVISGDAAVHEYNKTLGEHYGKVKTLSEAVAGYGKYSQEFIKAKIAEAAAMKLTDQTADEVLKREVAREGIRNLRNKEVVQAWNELITAAAKTKAGTAELYKELASFPTGTEGSLDRLTATTSVFGQELFKLKDMAGGKKFLDYMKQIGQSNENIAATEKTIKSLYSTLNDEFTKPDPKETLAQKLKRLSDAAIAEAQLRNEAAENAIKEEEDYQSEDFSKKQAYEKRLFDLKQQFEAEKFGILVTYQQKTKAQQQAFLATQQNDALAFEKKQTAAVKKELEKRKKDVANARKALLTLLSGKGGYGNEQAEIQAVTEKYDAELKAYKDSLKAQGKASEEQMFELMTLEIQTEEQKQEAIAAIKAEYRERELSLSRAGIIQQFADESALAREGIETRYGITKKRIDGELALLNKKYNADQAMSEKDAERYKKLLAEREANDKAYEENKVAVKEFFMEKANEILSSLNDVAAGFDERDKERVQENRDKAVSALDERLSKGIISQKSHDAQVKKLDESLDKEKQKIARRQAIRERLMATISIGMNTAKAIMGIWADFPKIDFGVSAATASGIVAALGLAQAAAVWSQPMPKASRGLLLQGPSHAGGGIPIEAEGGEAIINKRSTSMFKPLLSAINAAGGGVRFATGGMPVGLANDGGFSARQAFPVSIGPTAKEIAEAVAEMQISVSVEQIEKATTKYVRVRGRASY